VKFSAVYVNSRVLKVIDCFLELDTEASYALL
jgi:hypothetical protein